MITYTTNSVQETNELAKKLAKDSSARIFLLTGELGSGKTTFVQGFAQGLGIKEKVVSPTFVLIREYQTPKTKRVLCHIDLYRLETENQLKNLGFDELLNNPNYLILIEWAEKLNEPLKQAIKITIKKREREKKEVNYIRIIFLF